MSRMYFHARDALKCTNVSEEFWHNLKLNLYQKWLNLNLKPTASYDFSILYSFSFNPNDVLTFRTFNKRFLFSPIVSVTFMQSLTALSRHEQSFQNPPLSLGHKTLIVKNNTVTASVIPFMHPLFHPVSHWTNISLTTNPQWNQPPWTNCCWIGNSCWLYWCC